jgi:RNA polymerase sigma factor (sigma-70 family)
MATITGATLTTDRQLLDSFVTSKSEAAFVEIVQRHTAMIYSTARRILDDAQLAEDATQAAFLVLAEKAKTLGPSIVLGAWLYVTAEHMARNIARSQNRRDRREQEAATMREVLQTQAEATDEELASTLRTQLDAALSELPEVQRQAIVLRCLENRSAELAAREIGCSENALSMRLHRGLETLRARLKRRGVETNEKRLLGLFAVFAAETPPPAMVVSIHAACLGKAGASTLAMVTAKGAIQMMFWAKMGKLAIAALIILFLGGSITLLRAAQEEKTRALNTTKLLERISNGLETYQLHFRKYPASTPELTHGILLKYYLGSAFRKGAKDNEVESTINVGPLVTFQPENIVFRDSKQVVADIWGSELHYSLNEKNNAKPVTLYSFGPNKIDEQGNGDDITLQK